MLYITISFSKIDVSNIDLEINSTLLKLIFMLNPMFQKSFSSNAAKEG